MCGITGKLFFNKERTIDKTEVRNMTSTLIHRGPDDEGFYFNNYIGLGFRRLSIIDLKAGHQPLSNQNETVWITFNGEIYNYIELRDDLIKKGFHFSTSSDTEVVLNMYLSFGEDCLKYLRGMFAFVIWDDNKKTLFGARDRFGIKPFFYYIDNEKFVWGSEIKAIMAADEIDKSINLTALNSYFTYGYTPTDQTIYTTVNKLEPSTYFILSPFEKGKISFHKYWNISLTPLQYSSMDELVYNIHDEFKQAVKMHMISDVPLGAFLSGGIDSSSVVAFMSQISSIPVKTFSIGFKEDSFSELEYARLVSKKYGTEHYEMIVEPESVSLLSKLVRAYDEPFADSSAIPTYYVSKFAREHVTVVLSGDGGDELFAGYNSYSKLYQLYTYKFNTRLLNHLLFKGISKLLPDYFYGKSLSFYLSKDKNKLGAYYCLWRDYEKDKLYNKHFKAVLKGEKAEEIKENLLSKYSNDYVSNLQKLDMQTYLPDDILTKVDRASMINSLEARVPILDHKFAELSFTIPSFLKLHQGNKKYIFKETMRSFLPNEVFTHPKQGFAVPLKYWFREDLKKYTNETLLSSKKITEYLDLTYIQKVIQNHQKGIRDYSQKIWSLLFFNEWLNQNL